MKTFGIVVMVALFGLMGCDKKKDTASLTYSCTMNGYGSGQCTFTNAASEGEGAKCGKIKVMRRDRQQEVVSEVFCSGKVEASSSKKVEFSIPQVNSLCENEGAWNLVCGFDFIAND